MERIGDVIDEMRRTGRLDKGIKVQSLSDVWPLFSLCGASARLARTSPTIRIRLSSEMEH